MNKEQIQAALEKEAEKRWPIREGDDLSVATKEINKLMREGRKNFMANHQWLIPALATLPVSEVKSGGLDKERILALPDNECIRCNTKEEVIELCEIIGIPFNGQIWDLYKSFTCIWVKDASWESLSHAKTTNCIVHNISDFYFATHPVEPSQPVKELTEIEESEKDCQDLSELMIKTEYGEVHPLDIPEWLREVFESNACTYADYVSGQDFVTIINFLNSRGYKTGITQFAPANEGLSVDWEKVREEIGTGLAKVHWAEWEAWHPGCVTWQEMTPEHQKELLAKEKSAATFCANYLKSHLNVAGEVVEWASVEDRLPENGFDCIIWDENKGMPLIASYDHMQSMWRDNFQDMYEGQPTHWKPLNLTAPAYTK